MTALRALVPAVLLLVTACKWEKGKIGGPAFKKSSEQVKVRALAGAQHDAGIEIGLEDGSLTRIRTALGLDECSYTFKVRLKNVSDAPSARFRGPALQWVDTQGRARNLSGPLGCGDSTLAAGQACSATFYTHVQPRDCADPAALLLGTARLPVSL